MPPQNEGLCRGTFLMFVFGSRTKWFAAVLAVAAMAAGAGSAQAQKTKRQRRETNVNRQARINRTIKDTYTRRYEVAGGGGFLRFRSGEYLKRNNEVTWATSGTYFLNPKLGITADVRGSYGNANIPNAFALNGQFRPLINEYMFSGGPTYRLYMREKYSISAVVTGGLAIGNFSGGNKGVSIGDGRYVEVHQPARDHRRRELRLQLLPQYRLPVYPNVCWDHLRRHLRRLARSPPAAHHERQLPNEPWVQHGRRIQVWKNQVSGWEHNRAQRGAPWPQPARVQYSGTPLDRAIPEHRPTGPMSITLTDTSRSGTWATSTTAIIQSCR